MKLLNTKARLATSLLALAFAISPSGFAQEGANNSSSSQRDRAETTLPTGSDRTPATGQEARDRANQEAQGRTDSQQPGDTASTPGMHACENSHAPTGAPDLTQNENTRRGNSRPNGNAQANNNAQQSGADQNAQEAETSRDQIAQGGDDCLDPNGSNNEDARGQGTGQSPDINSGSQGAGNGQTRDEDG